MNYVPGQRWHSLTEPELGLGLIEAVEHRQIVVSFPARGMTRRYTVQNAPLARAQLTPGQRARGSGADFRVEEVTEQDGLLIYAGEGQQLLELQLDADLDVSAPENRLRSGQVDPPELFDLRRDALSIRHRLLSSPARGFLGGRITLFDHQLSIARDVCERHRARVLLADEVGLGKTIEALLIMHRMLLTGRIENALILVPPALVHQWLAEAYLRFNLVLRVVGSDTYEGGTIDPEADDIPEQLLDAQLFICPLGSGVSDEFVESGWDLVIVDEAHHLQSGSDEFQLVERLAEVVEHVILLSATPDRDGEDEHVRRLALLDPVRFEDAEAYRAEAAGYRELADLAERLQADEALTDPDRAQLARRLGEEVADDLTDDEARDRRRQLLGRLLDLHGIGRVMFRNVRARIPGFPRRVPQPAVLPGSGSVERLRREFLHDNGQDDSFHHTGIAEDPRTRWLLRFLEDEAEGKVLVLCATRRKAEAFATALTEHGREVARFHEEMSAIERDRQAAWFLDAEGPQAVISSAVGAEGRNFQVARHLVLMDLPVSADRLEQAIGRVDRIGQGAQVFLHPVVVEGSPQARLRRWHDEALGIFERPWHGAPVIEREFGSKLHEALLADDETPLEQLIVEARRRNAQIVADLESGRDRLLELTSFDVDAARELQAAIRRAESDGDLERFMLDAFERGGLDIEDLGERSWALRAGDDYHRPFPGFHGEEMGVTFDRATGLRHPERTLLTWDHPMVRDTVDSLLDNQTGNASLALARGPERGLRLEASFVAEPGLDASLRADRFLPPAPIHVVVDFVGEEADLEGLTEWQPADPQLLDQPEIQTRLPDLIESARALAEKQAPAVAGRARRQMRRELEPVVDRWRALAARHPGEGEAELAAARDEMAQLDEGLQAVRVRLDGARIVLVTDE